MTRLDAHTIFTTLEAAHSNADVDYAILSPPGQTTRNAHLAVSRTGAASLLIPVAQVSSETTRLTHGLAFRGVKRLEFARGAERWREPAAVVECREPKLLQTFAAMAAAVVARLETTTKPTWDTVARLFDEWNRLLARRRVLSGESELGLWGELWCLARTTRVDLLLDAWLGPEKRSIDFLLDGLGIEVKAGGRAGVHQLSQAQVDEPVGDIPSVLMSLHVVPDPLRGRTLAALVEDVAGAVSDIAEFEEKLAGVGYSRADELAYVRSYVLAQAPLFYAADSIPRIRTADPGVSHIRYQVELRGESALRDSQLAAVHSALGIDLTTYDYPCA